MTFAEIFDTKTYSDSNALNAIMTEVDEAIAAFTVDGKTYEHQYCADANLVSTASLMDLDQAIDYYKTGSSLKVILSILSVHIPNYWRDAKAEFTYYNDLYIFTVHYKNLMDARVINVY